MFQISASGIRHYFPKVHIPKAFAVASYLEGKLLRYWSVSDRLAVLQLSLGRHSTLTVINDYGPTSQVTLHDQNTQDDFYSALDSVTTRYSSSTLILIAGDFNSKLGRKLTNERSIGEHSCGVRNTNGTVLAGFLETHGLFACNNAFQQATRHKTTWQGQYRDANRLPCLRWYTTRQRPSPTHSSTWLEPSVLCLEWKRAAPINKTRPLQHWTAGQWTSPWAVPWGSVRVATRGQP